jgi:hypothetical protein
VTARRELQLADGRTVYLRWLQQHEVYAGLLEGLPTRDMNERHIRSLVEDARKRTSAAPYLVPPTESPIDYGGPYPFGEPVALPRIACVGHFESLSPARDPSQDYSGLIIIWFQEDYAFPIEPEALEQILAVDWARLAADHEF